MKTIGLVDYCMQFTLQVQLIKYSKHVESWLKKYSKNCISK